jgi:glucokinase
MAETAGIGTRSLGIEVSPSVLTAVCLGEDGTIAKTWRKELGEPKGTIERVTEFVADLKNEFGGFDSLGVAVPGLIHRETRRVAFSQNIPEHSDIDLTTGIQEGTGVRTVIENDANAAAYGEFKLGAGRESRDLFYATLGAGVGGAFIFDGAIWHGKAGFAGEFGFVAINAEGMRLEDVASAANIVRRTRSRMRQDNTSSLSSIDEYSLTLSDILSAAEVEDDLAKMMLERTGEYVGTAIASVINLLNIETIVLGGELMEAGHHVLDAVTSRARELSFGPSFANTRLLAGTLGRNAAAAGAAMIAAEN